MILQEIADFTFKIDFWEAFWEVLCKFRRTQFPIAAFASFSDTFYAQFVCVGSTLKYYR